MAVSWHIVGPDGKRWNHLHGSWDLWIFGTDYKTREEADEEALMLVVKRPEYIGKIVVEASI